MTKYYAIFTNQKGWRLTIFFKNENWNGINEAALNSFNKIEEHKKYGPWTLGAIDVTG